MHHSIDENWSNPSQLQTYDIHFKSDDASTVFIIATLNGYFKFLINKWRTKFYRIQFIPNDRK